MTEDTTSTDDRRIAKNLDQLDRTDGYKHEHYSWRDVYAAMGISGGQDDE